MKALIDRHQADLFYALQLIFEDTLGGAVYTPIGREWWDEGYWRFGEAYGDERLVDQYLGIHEGIWTPGWHPGAYTTIDGHHPDRPIRGLTLDLAKKTGQDINFVVATVQENQQGLARFAREIGAKYVYQVGNTRQQVDWSLDPLALVSSEVPIEGRGVVMHQPFDHTGIFGFRDPAEAQRRFSSFVNLMPRLADWPLWEGYRAHLPGWETKVYGIDGYDGNLEPVERIAEAMATSAFGLHLKPTGDGFGHVLHNWAAIGRPIIGRASYYRGQMGERFWQDTITCIDLDQRSPLENVALIDAIWNDKDRYGEMCRAIRAEFDKIDWPGEAAAIKAFLS